jgi:iron(III) transport system ATP-binding protein
MIELSVENLHLTYGDNPVLKGVSMTLAGRGGVAAGAVGQRQNHAAAGGGRAGKPTSGRIAIGNRTVYDGTPRSEIPAEERNLGWCFSPMPCGRTKRCSTTWPIR